MAIICCQSKKMKSKINTSQRLVIISPGYNCDRFLNLWWNSIRVQNYTNWICIAVNDMSTDATLDRLLDFSRADNRLYVVDNQVKKYQLQNWYDVIAAPAMTNAIVYQGRTVLPTTPAISDEDIIVFIDLDDWFGTKYALELIAKEYLYRDILCTTGRNFSLSDYYNHDGELYFDRRQCLRPEHIFSLVSYKAKLFRLIPREHFYEESTGKMYRVCGDYCITMPMFYIAGPEHHAHHFVDNLIIYNNIRPECDDHKQSPSGEPEHQRVGKLIHLSLLSLLPRLNTLRLT